MPSKRRVAIVGARRTRQGLGSYIARGFRSHGADVVAVCTRSRDTAALAAADLKTRYGIEARPFGSMEEMLRTVPADIIAICSPTRAHREHLEIAARFPVHVLCEKPMWWDDAGVTEAETRRLLDEFEGRTFALNTQWPCTLGAFRELYGDEPLRDVRRFAMLLSPISEGVEMILDSAPHLISMLQALAGEGELENVVWERTERATFRYAVPGRPIVDCEFLLRRCVEPPRPAWYAVNDLRADRRIRMPEYAFEFHGGGRTIPAPDPLDLLIKEFLSAVEKGDSTPKRSILSGMRLLTELTKAATR